ncbi:MAG: hypothetical protein PWP16_674 [Eubacteriaceae bacterium]|jgi:hypothetical protein|nr:hypothetical protein [Eubacteriaceae bacterium]MDK2904445.1 hypothetical protein [Eubacteriaceae bacterium]MDK2936786.1 hypothetical protein [Eubacteriaceae bacterium]MDK2961225.1 hypothetical protein [Eubacteriaceae bacterium]MDN5307311.1 hypothetical protein [Eubacteriaceae bacterium]
MGYFGADVQVSTKKINNITEKVRKILKEELSEEELNGETIGDVLGGVRRNIVVKRTIEEYEVLL